MLPRKYFSLIFKSDPNQIILFFNTQKNVIHSETVLNEKQENKGLNR